LLYEELNEKRDNISIIVPTFNERECLPEICKRLDESIKKYNYEIIVVDDDSPDGTANVARELSKDFPIHLIERKEKGLATAVIRGIQESKNENIVVIDADLQHPPEKIPQLIEALNNGADIAIGSRFVEGGSIRDWSYSRLFISKGARFLATTLFRDLRKIKDIESGFFAFKNNVINNVELKPTGYKILLEILVVGNYNNVEEVDFEFQNRKYGKSKLGYSNISSYIRHLLSLSWRTKELHRFLTFCLIGALGAIINLGILYLLTNIYGIYYLISGAIGIEAGLLSNFVLNKIWTFKDREVKGLKSIGRALYRDHVVRFIGILLNLFVLWFLTTIGGIYYIFSQIVGIFVAMMWNFIGNKWFTWE
jgi:dolichol-phosphate mannosyltransferase